jgi:hypothetical protein
MANKKSADNSSIALPSALETREVFLDTDAYERLGFNLARPEFSELLKLVADDRLRLHTTDITMREVLGHLTNQAQEAIGKVDIARRSLALWREHAPKAAGKSKTKHRTFDASKMASERFMEFKRRLHISSEQDHAATNVAAIRIFKDWFDRKPPFDEGHKEFPDAFVVAALADWCELNATIMYVVTQDKAMQRAALASPHLVPVNGVSELLQAAVAAHSPEVETEASQITDTTSFAKALGTAIDGHLGDVELMYWGDFGDGELTDPQRVGEPTDIDAVVISARSGSLGLIVSCEVRIRARLDFEDISNASFDKEECAYFNVEHGRTEIEEDATLRLFVQVDQGGLISQSDLLTQEIAMREETDTGY